jgi:lysyl-tRNA synthetase, class II
MPEPCWRSRPPLSRTAVARIVQFVGVFDVLTTVLPPRHGRIADLTEFVPTTGMLSARAATAVAGVLLVYVGAGLRRGKHRAWLLAVGAAAAGTLLHVVKGLDLDAAAVSAALLALLIVVRKDFHALADRRNRWRAAAALVGFGGTGFLLGFAEIAIRENRLIGAPGVGAWAEQAVLGLVGVPGPLRFVSPIGAEAVTLTTGAFGLLAAVATVILLLRPGTHQPENDDVRLREAIRKSNDSLAYFALREDKSVVWSPNGTAGIAYRVINGVSLASGDPIGPESAWPDVIAAWLAECATYGRTPAVLGCGKTGGRAYRRHGLDVIEIGDEAILDVPGFSLQGRPMRGVRQAVNRMQRAGYTCTVTRQADMTAEELAEAVRAATDFRDGSVERGFSMALSRFGDPRDGDCVLVIARDVDRRIRGVLQFVPWRADGWSLDLMRGDRTAENGLTEMMVVAAAEAAHAFGVRRISLNFAVLRSVFARAEELGAGPVLRLWHRLLKVASRLWQIESLYRANAKYQPEWVPRYLCFPTARDLPRIAIAALTAEAFLPTIGRTPKKTAQEKTAAPERTRVLVG